MTPTATLLILSGPRAGAAYPLGIEEVFIGEHTRVRWENGRHIAHVNNGPARALNAGDELLIGDTRFAYHPALLTDDRHTLLRATTLLYLFRSWEQMRGDSPVKIVESHIVHIIADLLGYSGPLTGEIVDSPEPPAAGNFVTVPLFIQGKLDATVVLHLPPSEQYIDTLSSVASLASVALESARETATLRNEVALLAEQIFTGGIVGDSPPIRRLLQMIERVAASESTVLILGESGTGKELVARAIHQRSARQLRSFVPINCAAITDTLVESELFGHEKGSFTGAAAQKKGRLEMAQGGTVFLDEVGELAPGLQAKLLRVLQERELVRVGGTQAVKLDVRVLAATNRDLAADVRSGAFREDLYHRLNVIALRTPPLRDRKEDIPALARHFLAKICHQCRRRMTGFSPEAAQALLAYDWPGNIRELENAIERAVVLAETDAILPEDLPEAISEAAVMPGSGAYQQSVGDAKRDSILRAYEQSGGDYKAAARVLGIHPNYLLRLVRNLGLKDEVVRRSSK